MACLLLSTKQIAWLVLRRSYYVPSFALIRYARFSTSGRCKDDRSSFTLDCCGFAYHLRNCDHGLHCSFHLYRNAISLCAPKANLCYTCLVGLTIQVCHFSEPDRPGAIERLVHSRCV